jgi:uncharacterized protein YbaP (TraB family)
MWEIKLRGQSAGFIVGTTHIGQPKNKVNSQLTEIIKNHDVLFIEKTSNSALIKSAVDSINDVYKNDGGVCAIIDMPCQLLYDRLRILGKNRGQGDQFIAELSRMHPYFLSLLFDTLAEHSPQLASNNSIETQAQASAKQRQIKVFGLESIDVMSTSVLSLKRAEGLALINRSLDFLMDGEAKALKSHWISTASMAIDNGDCEKLLEQHRITFSPSKILESAYSKLYASRNDGMAKNIHSKVVSGEQKKMLFILGAFHVCGEENVIDSLRKMGLTVTKVMGANFAKILSSLYISRLFSRISVINFAAYFL